ncbi:MAG: cupin domain-containing protein [Anaerolineales bacterium]|nr:cupin domain-containing protein [Anaerolineales bacterium]
MMDDTGTEPNVGSRVRKIRDLQKLSLRALSERCGLSANAISLIERGENSPTVSSLHRLATGLDVPITDFFQKETGVSAISVKKSQGLRFQNNLATLESLGIGLPNQQLEPFRMTVAPEVDNLNDPISHPGEEFVHCLEGMVTYWVGDQEFVLSAGDGLLFDATQPHCWKNQNKKPSVVILVFQTAQSDLSARQQHMKTEPQSTDYE